MTVDTDELVAWLREALDEDQRVAQAAADNANPEEPWYDEGAPTAEQEAHAARWDPARVLAEVEAKRARIDTLTEHSPGSTVITSRGGYRVPDAELVEYLLLLEADPYQSRPGFRPEWRLT